MVMVVCVLSFVVGYMIGKNNNTRSFPPYA